MRYLFFSTLLFLVSSLSANLLADFASARQDITVRIRPRASLVRGGQSLLVEVRVACKRDAGQLLESFVHVVQDERQSSFAPIPVVCDSRARRYSVPVIAAETPFESGWASASAYVVFSDETPGDSVSRGDIQLILIR